MHLTQQFIKLRQQLWSEYLGIPTHVMADSSIHSNDNYRRLTNHCLLLLKVHPRKKICETSWLTFTQMLLHHYTPMPEPLPDLI